MRALLIPFLALCSSAWANPAAELTRVAMKRTVAPEGSATQITLTLDQVFVGSEEVQHLLAGRVPAGADLGMEITTLTKRLREEKVLSQKIWVYAEPTLPAETLMMSLQSARDAGFEDIAIVVSSNEEEGDRLLPIKVGTMSDYGAFYAPIPRVTFHRDGLLVEIPNGGWSDLACALDKCNGTRSWDMALLDRRVMDARRLMKEGDTAALFVARYIPVQVFTVLEAVDTLQGGDKARFPDVVLVSGKPAGVR